MLWTMTKTASKKWCRRVPGLKRLVHMWDRMAILEQSLAVLRSSLQSKIMLQETRFEQRLAELGDVATTRTDRPDAGLSAAGLEFLMAHARLPAPPGPVWDPSGILDFGGIDLSSLGYQITRDQTVAEKGPRWSAILYRLDEMPSKHLRGVDSREKMVTDALRMLRPGGRLILSLLLAEDEATPDWLTHLPTREMVRARRDEKNWTFAPPRKDAEQGGKSMLLGVVEKC